MKSDAEIYSYHTHRRYLETCRAKGFSFGETLDVLDRLFFDVVQGDARAKSKGHRSYYGAELIKLPNFGDYHEVPMELAPASMRFILMWYLRRFVKDDLAAVVELGAGAGDLIVSLARDFLDRKTRFIAAELTPDALKCTEVLAGLTKIKVEGHLFDVRNPVLDFIPKDGETLIFANGLLSFFDIDTLERFFDALLTRTQNFNFHIFDVLSPHLAAVYKNHKPMPVTDGWGANFALFNVMSRFPERMRVCGVIPDLCGKMPLYPLSALHVAPVAVAASTTAQ